MSKQKTNPRALSGASFLPADLPDVVEANPPVRLWVGVVPECPVEQFDFLGLTFVKHTDRLVDDPANPDRKRRIPQIGMIGYLDADRFEEFRRLVARTVIRFRNPEEVRAARAQTTEDGARVMGDPVSRLPAGYPIKIPTQADLENRRAQKLPATPYIRHPSDEPAARYIYAIPCEDQRNGRPGSTYPAPLEVTGLEVPQQETAAADPTDALIG